MQSPATRALHTASIFAKNLSVPASKVAIDDALYHSSAEEILAVVRKTSDMCDAVMYCAQPGITDFVNEMTSASVRNVPTTGVVIVRFDCHRWEDIGPGADLIQFEHPKRLKN